MIYVDDNIGELLSVADDVGNINMILANKNINKTVLSLQNLRLYKWKKSELDSIRAYDLKANDLRDRIKHKS